MPLWTEKEGAGAWAFKGKAGSSQVHKRDHQILAGPKPPGHRGPSNNWGSQAFPLPVPLSLHHDAEEGKAVFL